jgi:hypothetical protein
LGCSDGVTATPSRPANIETTARWRSTKR